MLTTVQAGATTRRRARVALLGAAGAAALTLPLAAPAGADAGFDYSGKTGAIGIQVLFDSNPEPAPVPDLTDVQVPSLDATFDSYGTSDASAHVGNLNGLGALPGLVCLAGLPCSSIPVPFPPPDPLNAHASYPSPKTADAPAVQGKPVQLTFGTASSAQFAVGSAHSEADLQHVSSNVQGGKSSLLGQITVGATTATQISHIVGGALVSRSEATLSDINIGTGLIHIGSIDAVSDVTTKPGSKPVDKSFVKIGDVTVVGQAATIDQDGVHLSSSNGLASLLNGQLQQFVNNVIAAGGLTIKAIGVTASDDDSGHTSLAQGLLIGVKSTVQGLPALTVGLPAGVPCPIPSSVLEQFSVNPCAGVGLNANGDYFGQIVLGQAGTISLVGASSDDLVMPAAPIPSGPVSTPGTPTGAPPSTPATTIGGDGGTSTFTPPDTTGLPPTGPQPSVAPPAPNGGGTRTVALSEDLGLHGRLLWLFPVMLLAVVGAIAGRLRAPHRLPGQRR